MPSVAQVNPQNVWPLGKLTVNHGVPVQVTSVVGSQDAGKSDAGVPVVMPQGRAYSSTCTQLVFSCPSTNTSDVIVTYGNFAAPDANLSMLAIPKGVTLSIPMGAEIQSGQIDPSRFWIDGTTTGDVVYAFAIGGN